MKKRITIPYFERGMRYITPFFILGGIYLGYKYSYYWTLALCGLALIILTTYYVTTINLKKKKCYDFLFFLGLPLNLTIIKFDKISKIAITKGSYSQTVNTRAQGRQLDWSDYTASLIFNDGNQIDLLTRNTKPELIKGIRDFTDFLNVGVQDCTTNEHYWVDLTKVN